MLVSRVINLIAPESQRLWAVDESEARYRLLASDMGAVLDIDGSFAIVAQDGERVVLARSLDRPMRYFLAKSVDGPVLIVAERIDEIAAELERRVDGQRSSTPATRAWFPRITSPRCA
jgi:asparagine synthase (glutamine-hydrolysing)